MLAMKHRSWPENRPKTSGFHCKLHYRFGHQRDRILKPRKLPFRLRRLDASGGRESGGEGDAPQNQLGPTEA